jgi:tRNA (cmo5U34)-methyltransferase
VAAVLRAGGRFVMGDVVVPARPEDAITPIGPDYDFPSAVPDQVRWLEQAGFSAAPTWVHGDLAVVAADRA